MSLYVFIIKTPIYVRNDICIKYFECRRLLNGEKNNNNKSNKNKIDSN